MRAPLLSDAFSMDALDWGLAAGIVAHFYLQQQSGVQPPLFPGTFPTFLPGFAVIPWSAVCLWGAVRVPQLKRVFQCLAGVLLYTASAPLLAMVRHLPLLLAEGWSAASLVLTFASYAAISLTIRSFGLGPWAAAGSPELSKRLRAPVFAMAGAFVLSLLANISFRGSDWVPVISAWCFSAPFALNLVLIRHIPEATTFQEPRSPQSWRQWLGPKTVLGFGGLMVASGTFCAVFLRSSKLLHPAPDAILEQMPWGPRYLFLLRQGYRLWFPASFILVLQILAILRIQGFAEQAASSSHATDGRYPAELTPPRP